METKIKVERVANGFILSSNNQKATKSVAKTTKDVKDFFGEIFSKDIEKMAPDSSVSFEINSSLEKTIPIQ